MPVREFANQREAYIPRFRALALFGRRLPKRVVRSSLPASENLHNCGLNAVQQSTSPTRSPRRPRRAAAAGRAGRAPWRFSG